MNKQVHVFTLDSCQVKAVVKDNWVEFNFYPLDGVWRRFFISTAGYNGTNEELEAVARDLIDKINKIDSELYRTQDVG